MKKLLKATKNILEKNLELLNPDFKNKKIILIFDKKSKLSQKLSDAYLQNLKILNKKTFFEKLFFRKGNVETFDFYKNDKDFLKNKLLNLPKKSTVILVQSTNFRLDNFRIRLNLHNHGIGCLEHNHLSYIKDEQIKTYIDSIKYRGDFYGEISEILKNKIENADEIIFKSKDGSVLRGIGGVEEVRKNIGDYSGKNRGSTFPVGEIFTEIKDFSKLNGEISINCFPGEDFQIIFSEPFKLKIENSLVKKIVGEKYPKEFLKLLEKIEKLEDGEIFLRELGFGLNPGISNKNPLSDVNSFERKMGFHISLGKKHNIYRKKFHKNISQRFHIDIFPDLKNIFIKKGENLEAIFSGDENGERFL